LGKTGANITVNMRVGWFDASKKSIAPLEQTFFLNFITPYTEVVYVNPCASAVAVLKGSARDVYDIAFTEAAADGTYQNRHIHIDNALTARIED
jgi:cell division protein FtsX